MGFDGMDGKRIDPAEHALARRLAFGRFRARLALLAEQALPLVLAPLSVLSLFLSSAWFGLFAALPDSLRWGLALLLAFALLASLLPFLRLRWPDRQQAERRLERINQIPHQAIGALDDRPVTETAFARALFDRHRQRMAASIDGLEPGIPQPDISRFDAAGLRSIPALVFVIALAFSISPSSGRISDAFVLKSPDMEKAGLRVDVWATPPAYTGRPAITLTEGQATAALPQFSILTVQISGASFDDAVSYLPLGAQRPAPLQAKPMQDGSGGPHRESFEVRLDKDGVLAVGNRAYPIRLLPDRPPHIEFDGKPRRTVNGALEIRFKAKDDYRLKMARADIVPLDLPPQATPLFDLPDDPLDLPGTGKGEIKGVSSRNLTDHPLAGTRVRISLLAEDDAGQTGRSSSIDMILPARDFSEPLAAAVAEERQIFALDTRDQQKALDYNDALTLRGDESIPNITHYLLLKSARSRIAFARDDAGLKDAAAYLWDIALGIDGGDLPMAEKAVRDAQKALADALARNAPDTEIKALMQDLRKAMKDYMAALSRRLQQVKPGQQQGEARNVIRQQDLERMMDQLENMARSGNKDAARQLLSEMQQLMNNLQAGPGQGRPPTDAENKARAQVDKLGKILRDQQKLLEDNYQQNQKMQKQLWQNDPGVTAPLDPGLSDQGETDQGQPPGEGQNQPMPPGGPPQETPPAGQNGLTQEQRQALQSLQQRQDALQKQVEELGQGLKELGVKPLKGLGDAGREMGDAAKALGRGEGEPAVEGEGRAVDALRKAARQMMQALKGDGQGTPGPGGVGQSGTDPLGRSSSGPDLGNGDSANKLPNDIDVQRAREILEEIRRKLGESGMAPASKHYLERLLNAE